MRPRIRIPISVALGVVLLAWLIRSLVRGDFGLDMPQDLVALGAVVIGVSAVWLLRRSEARHNGTDDELQD